MCAYNRMGSFGPYLSFFRHLAARNQYRYYHCNIPDGIYYTANSKQGYHCTAIETKALTDEELLMVKKFYVKLAKLAEKENDLYGTHSLDDAERIHENKMDAEERRSKKPRSAAK